MSCLYAQSIQNKKFLPNKKNGGNPPPLTDRRQATVPTKCGKCSECRKSKRNDWTQRLLEEIKSTKNARFVTLTFSDESYKTLADRVTEIKSLSGYNLDNAIAYKAKTLFFDRFRKYTNKTLRGFVVTELGGNGTENLHFHAILFTDLTIKEIQKIWSYGFITVGNQNSKGAIHSKIIDYVNASTISYITKYITKVDFKHKTYVSQIYVSKGLGKNYITSYNASRNAFQGEDTKQFYTAFNGQKMPLCKYYKDAIYTPEQLTQLGTINLNKNQSFIGGQIVENVNTEKGQKQLALLINEARQKDTRLGYCSAIPNPELKQYEDERRNINYKTRVQRTIDKKQSLSNKTKIKQNLPIVKVELIPQFDPDNPNKLFRRTPLIIPKVA